jgi:hypothetical protein
VLWIWIQNLQFGSGTREKPSGYTTHEITIFKYKMGDFFFWPKNGVSAIKVSLWYFKTKILPFYSLLSGSSSWGMLSNGLVGLILGHPSALLLYDGSASFLSRFGLSGSLPLQNFSQIVIVHFHNFVKVRLHSPFKWGRGRGSGFAGSDARWVSYPFFHNKGFDGQSRQA